MLPGIDIEAIRAEKSRRSLKQFINYFWTTVEPNYAFVSNWHIDAICDHLANIWEIKNLLINCPPRSMKTLIAEVFWPIFLWLHEPGTKFMYASYGLDVATQSSLKCRDLIFSPKFQKAFGHHFKLKEDRNNKTYFENDKNGSRLASSVGGVTTGFGADVLCVDDPHNVKKTESELERTGVINWFNSAWYNRLNDLTHGCRLVIGQRVHRLDLSGWILENMKEDWVHLCLPYEHQHIVSVPVGWEKLNLVDPRTEEGQPLWPERFPENEIKQYKKNRATWETQFNQKPIDASTAMFKAETFRYCEETETHYVCGDDKVAKSACFRVMACDLALTTKAGSDYTVAIVADISRHGEIIFLHVYRDRIPSPKIIPVLQGLSETFHPSYILVEEVAFQKVIYDQLKREGLAVRGLRPQDDKEARMFPLQLRFDNGQVWFMKNKPWITTLEKELIEFPGSVHDDQADTASMLAIEANKRTYRRKAEETPKEETEDERKARLILQYNQALFLGIR